MPEDPWKANENAIARWFPGARRVPVAGRIGNPDIRHPWLSIEVKLRKSLPLWLEGALRQAEAVARGKLPIAVLHGKGNDHADDLVVLRLSDFVDYFVGDETDAD